MWIRGAKEPCIGWGPDFSTGRGNFEEGDTPSHCKIQGLCGGVYVAVLPGGRLRNYCGHLLYVGDVEVDVVDAP